MCPHDDDTLAPAGEAPGFAREHAQPTVAFDTPTSRIDVHRGRSSPQLALIVLAVAAAGFLVGIGIASLAPRTDDDPSLASQAVGPSGGTVRFDGGEIRIPSGALAEQRTISVHRTLVDRRVRVDPGGDTGPIVFAPGRLAAYRFEPADITFAQPVQVTFRLPTGAENGTVFARSSLGGIVMLEGRIDADRGTATTVVRDFRFGGRSS